MGRAVYTKKGIEGRRWVDWHFRAAVNWQALDWVTESQPNNQNSRQDISPARGRSTKENRDSAQMRGEISRNPGCRTKPLGWEMLGLEICSAVEVGPADITRPKCKDLERQRSEKGYGGREHCQDHLFAFATCCLALFLKNHENSTGQVG